MDPRSLWAETSTLQFALNARRLETVFFIITFAEEHKFEGKWAGTSKYTIYYVKFCSLQNLVIQGCI